MKKIFIPLVFSILSLGLLSSHLLNDNQANISESQNEELINPNGTAIKTRFHPPKGYERIKTKAHTFESYLQNLPLKEQGSEVLYFDGNHKVNYNTYVAVVDQKIGSRDLQQCADAVMRLRGEYFYSEKKYDNIHFNFLSDGKPRYYTSYVGGDYSYRKFLKYMDYVFAFANTRSLYNEMNFVAYADMQIGDVLIQTGNPYGHAVIVVDMAENLTTNQKVFMLAQSYMPAQETQILVNQNSEEISPWYPLNDEHDILTPEWHFTQVDLKRFENN